MILILLECVSSEYLSLHVSLGWSSSAQNWNMSTLVLIWKRNTQEKKDVKRSCASRVVGGITGSVFRNLESFLPLSGPTGLAHALLT